MSKYFPMVPIGEVAYSVERPEVPLPGTVYRQVGVHLWGEGAYERESIDGGETKYSTLYCVESDDIIVNKIWARNGSVAVVNGELAGCFCSGEFPIYAPDRNRIEPRWFHWITKTSWFWRECDLKSRGTSGKNRIRPEKFLEIQIPLPPVEEQHRIVAKVDELATKIGEVRHLRSETLERTDSYFHSELFYLFNKLTGEGCTKRLDEVTEIISDIDHAMPKATLSGVKFISPKDFTPNGINFTSCKQISRIDFERLRKKIQPRKGDILFSRIGTIGQARIVETDEEFLASYSIVTIRPAKACCEPIYLKYVLESPVVFRQAFGGVRAIAMPDLGIKTIRNFSVPVPDLQEQSRIITYLNSLQAKLNELKRLQIGASNELKALLPSILDKAFKGEL